MNDLLRIWTAFIGIALPLLVIVAALLGWPLGVQYALVALLLGAAAGTRRALARTHRRR
jgi:hypothetical protein